jgi:hypothetical protein
VTRCSLSALEKNIMPANLNALIRYKTINWCLHGGRRKWSIMELIEACSCALAESRGRYDTVSERTIRDDIRVMRSDILGFNAPIAQEQGLYFYSDADYSIMNISISDSELVMEIVNLLQELKTEISHPELETILEKLINLPGYVGIRAQSKIRLRISEKPTSYKDTAINVEEIHEIKDEARKSKIIFNSAPTPTMTWGEVFKVFL